MGRDTPPVLASGDVAKHRVCSEMMTRTFSPLSINRGSREVSNPSALFMRLAMGMPWTPFRCLQAQLREHMGLSQHAFPCKGSPESLIWKWIAVSPLGMGNSQVLYKEQAKVLTCMKHHRDCCHFSLSVQSGLDVQVRLWTGLNNDYALASGG